MSQCHRHQLPCRVNVPVSDKITTQSKNNIKLDADTDCESETGEISMSHFPGVINV